MGLGDELEADGEGFEASGAGFAGSEGGAGVGGGGVVGDGAIVSDAFEGESDLSCMGQGTSRNGYLRASSP